MKILEEGNQRIIEMVKEEAENCINREKILLFLQSLEVYESDENEENKC